MFIVCPICDGLGYKIINNEAFLCWVCKGKCTIDAYSPIFLSEDDIRNMYSYLDQRYKKSGAMKYES